MQPNTDHLIGLEGVEKRYAHDTVVKGIDLQIHAGECFVLIGQNGAGKTTLMKLMLGLTRPDTGQVRVLGLDPSSRSFAAGRRQLGYLPESVSFYPHMTGWELLNYYARLKRIAKTEVSQRLEEVGLKKAAHRRLHTYSKGMRQRLGLAQSMLGTPKLLFLDEPTTGLDPMLRRDFYRIMSELRTNGTTIVISSHALNEIEAQADRIAVIKQGELLACGNLKDLGRKLNLPIRTRLAVIPGKSRQVAEQLEGNARIEHVNKHSVDLICQEDHKMALLQQITDLGDSILDISMSEPRLTEVYLHYMNGEQP